MALLSILLSEMRVDIPSLVYVVEHMRFILIRSLIPSRVSSHYLLIDPHAPLFGLCTIDIVSPQVSH